MAELLYRLGKLAARRAWTVVVAWVLVLAVAAVAFAIGFKGLTTSFDIPGTASGTVIAELQEKLPDFSGASGTVVFETEDGSPFTEAQREQISSLVANAQDLPDVAAVVDAFDAETQRVDEQAQIEEGRTQIVDGSAQLDAGQAQLDAGMAQLDQAQTQLDGARQQLETAGAPAEQLAALDAQQAQLDAGRAELNVQQATIGESRKELTTQSEKLEIGEELLDLSAGILVVSEDGSTALVNVAFTEPRLELSAEAKESVVEHFESEAIDGVKVSFSTEIAQGVPQIIGIGEIIGVIIAGIVLLVMLGTAIAAALPLVTAIFGVAVAAVATLAFSGVVQMASVTPVLGVMLGLAVGIDYSLFIVNRHRKQLLQGAELRESVGLANGTAGNAVVFAGATVIVALFALNVTGIPFLGLMGTAGAIAVLIAVLIAVSLTPALLGLIGLRVLNRRARARIGEVHHEDTKARPMSTLRAVLTVITATVALLIVAIPALSMRLGLPDGGSEPAGSTTHNAFIAHGGGLRRRPERLAPRRGHPARGPR